MDMKILYIGNFDKPELNAAGKRVYGNALILEKLGYKVILIGKNRDYSNDKYPLSYGENIVFYSFPKISLINTYAYIRYIRNVIEIEGKPVFIIRYGTPGLAQFDKKLIFFCKSEKIKIISDVVDWLPSSGSSPVFNLLKGLDTYLEKSVYNKRSDGIISISSYLEKYYKKCGCKTIILPPIVSKYRENKTVNSKTKLVYAGVPFRLNREIKNPTEVKDRLDLTVKSIKNIAHRGVNIVIDIYGITQDQYLTAYPDQRRFFVSDDGCESVLFHGKKSMGEIQNAINSADFTILLRDRNKATLAGFPTKIVESLSCGTPVITTKTSDLEDYIIQGKNGFFVDISDDKKLQEDLINILSCGKDEVQKMKKFCFENRQFEDIMFTDALAQFLNEIKGIEEK